MQLRPHDRPLGSDFHSTKEGFKAVHLLTSFPLVILFPFHQGRFQGPATSCPCLAIPAGFPFHQGRFQGMKQLFGCSVDDLYFHSTKEGFKGRSAVGSRSALPDFHSTKEGFKGGPGCDRLALRWMISIPPRKVSRDLPNSALLRREKIFPFHQGRFQGRKRSCLLSGAKEISIPPRKVSRDDPRGASGTVSLFPFHQGRFQGEVHVELPREQIQFPFYQGRFQGMTCPPRPSTV